MKGKVLFACYVQNMTKVFEINGKLKEKYSLLFMFKVSPHKEIKIK